MKKTYAWGIAAFAIVAGVSFYAGMAYQGHSQNAAGNASVAGQFATGGSGGVRFAGNRGGAGGGLTAGTVIAKDAASITVKMQDGSTRIALISPDTQVLKTSAGAASDLAEGTNVAVMGTANPDGSVTAQSIQIRPTSRPGQPANGGQ